MQRATCGSRLHSAPHFADSFPVPVRGRRCLIDLCRTVARSRIIARQLSLRTGCVCVCWCAGVRHTPATATQRQRLKDAHKTQLAAIMSSFFAIIFLRKGLEWEEGWKGAGESRKQYNLLRNGLEQAAGSWSRRGAATRTCCPRIGFSFCRNKIDISDSAAQIWPPYGHAMSLHIPAGLVSIFPHFPFTLCVVFPIFPACFARLIGHLAHVSEKIVKFLQIKTNGGATTTTRTAATKTTSCRVATTRGTTTTMGTNLQH